MENAFSYVLIGVMVCLTVGLGFALVRAIRGPRMADRIVGINMTGSLTTAIIAVLAVYLKESWLLDVCIIYCLISFHFNRFVERTSTFTSFLCCYF